MVKKEKASVRIVVFPSTRKLLKTEAAKRGCTLANLVDMLALDLP